MKSKSDYQIPYRISSKQQVVMGIVFPVFCFFFFSFFFFYVLPKTLPSIHSTLAYKAQWYGFHIKDILWLCVRDSGKRPPSCRCQNILKLLHVFQYKNESKHKIMFRYFLSPIYAIIKQQHMFGDETENRGYGFCLRNPNLSVSIKRSKMHMKRVWQMLPFVSIYKILNK